MLFAEKDGDRAAAQIQAFEDTWQWDASAAASYEETVEAGGKVSQVLQAFRAFLGDNDMLAYFVDDVTIATFLCVERSSKIDAIMRPKKQREDHDVEGPTPFRQSEFLS